MGDKKQIKISLSALIVIVILLIILIGMGIYIVKLKSQPINDSNATNREVAKIDNSKNEVVNSKEQFAEIDVKSNAIKIALGKLDFYPHVIASMFQNGNFTKETIPNDLILRMGWSNYIEDYNTHKVSLSKEKMEENIKNIFGANMKYKDETFEATPLTIFAGMFANEGPYTYTNQTYIANLIAGDDNETANIWQEVYKAEKSEDKLKVYVRPIFYKDTSNHTESDIMGMTDQEMSNLKLTYELYKNISGNSLTDKLADAKEIFQVYNGDYVYTDCGAIIALENNKAFDSIRNQLNAYVYTFEIYNGNYYLSEFHKIK